MLSKVKQKANYAKQPKGKNNIFTNKKILPNMVKHNDIIPPNEYFEKYWQNYVKTQLAIHIISSRIMSLQLGAQIAQIAWRII
uniref:Uncharacterized protein n=1 Tax=Cannabis sativa TaxID=3483 RepID=A0A803R5M7_CANSA